MNDNKFYARQPSAITRPIVLHPRYLLAVAAVCAVSLVWLIPAISDTYLWIYGAVGLSLAAIISIAHAVLLMRRNNSSITESDKLPMVGTMAINPLVAIMIYFIILQKKHPGIARAALIIGMQVLAQYLLYVAVLMVIIVTLRVDMLNAWTEQDVDSFKGYITTIEKDVDDIFKNTKARDISQTRSACEKLSTNVNKGSALRAYPNKAIQDELTKGLTEIKKGSEDCLKGIDTNDTEAADRTTDEILDGYTLLNSAISKMQ